MKTHQTDKDRIAYFDFVSDIKASVDYILATLPPAPPAKPVDLNTIRGTPRPLTCLFYITGSDPGNGAGGAFSLACTLSSVGVSVSGHRACGGHMRDSLLVARGGVVYKVTADRSTGAMASVARKRAADEWKVHYAPRQSAGVSKRRRCYITKYRVRIYQRRLAAVLAMNALSHREGLVNLPHDIVSAIVAIAEFDDES